MKLPVHVLFEHAHLPGLLCAEDKLTLLRAEISPLAVSYLDSVHPQCHANGYAYLFLKVLTPELFPAAPRLIVLDSDVVVLEDISLLWREFDRFAPTSVLSMAVDQSDRYYYRMQDEQDEAFSAGWRGVPHTVGVNGGVVLLDAERARALRFSRAMAVLTHEGMRLRANAQLDRFCNLAEQDTLNLAILRFPAIWHPLDCSWNYMATGLGGHRMVPLEVAHSFYDDCPHGVFGSRGVPGDLLRCKCGVRVALLHFAGAARGSPAFALLNASFLALDGDSLRDLAKRRRAQLLPSSSKGSNSTSEHVTNLSTGWHEPEHNR